LGSYPNRQRVGNHNQSTASMSGKDDADESKRRYTAAYGAHHPIPTIQKYQKEKEARQAEARHNDEAGGDDDRSKGERLRDYWNGNNKENQEPRQNEQQESANGEQNEQQQEQQEQKDDEALDEEDAGEFEDEEPTVDTSEVDPLGDPKSRRKGFKRRKDERAERQVTDPVTHLPVTIHDFTSAALKDIPENDPPFGTMTKSATGLSNKTKSNQQLQKELHELETGRESMQALFPPPNYDAMKQEIADINKRGLTVGLGGAAVVVGIALLLSQFLTSGAQTSAEHRQSGILGISVWALLATLTIGAIVALIFGVREWTAKRIDAVWKDEVWEASNEVLERHAKAHHTESVTWLNALLGSVWPLVNPDLFTSLADTLEDVMQASLPKVVQMVAVEDLGQGSESIRILGVRWLPTGAAARSVASDGKLKSAEDSKHQNDRMVPGEGEVDNTADDKDGNDESKDNEGGKDQKDDQKQDDGAEKQVAEGMEAEEGDFINLEVAFAYRARSSKKFRDRTKDMHLFLAFYLPGNLKVPVWVDVRGVVGTMRLRLQLTPDPPFFALCTLTFLGQPKVDISCIPLVKYGLNIMDLPLISNFVQSSVDAAMAEYVAPKSLTLDLKDMLAGDDFKKDTSARGAIVIHIKRGYDFRMGDPSIPLIQEGGADPYVSVGWAKFGKPMWSTRILEKEMEPCWMETAFLLVTPEELNVGERLRVQLWDSDRFTGDDDLGRIELDLKTLMKDPETNGKMQDRTDGFRSLGDREKMPGKLEWSVGYFSKTRIQECQLQRQTYDPQIRSMEDLERLVDEECRRELREANIKGRNSKDRDELEQQKAQEMKAKQDAMIISAPPPDGYPSGIFSIQIHQITGLELEKLNKTNVNDEEEDEAESGEGLPSPYCTVIINHSKCFKTRTKPKNAKPFFNAGVERFVPDWRTAEVFVAVRDARLKEDDPLLGIVHLPLGEVFHERSQVNGFYPLMGGVGFGRVRISMVWRSVQLQAPPNLLGWDYGTLEVQPGVDASDVPQELQGLKLKFHTDTGAAKMYPIKDEAPKWNSPKHRSLVLAVRKRYASCLAVEFRRRGGLGEKTAAFAILWLRDIVDEEETEVTLPVWKGNFKRATACCMEEHEEKLGSIKLKLTFWSGLGSAHHQWARHEPNVQDVIEVLSCARDNQEAYKLAKEGGVMDEDATDDEHDDEDSSDDDDDDSKWKKKKDVDGANNDDDDGGSAKSKRNIFDSAMDYKRHMKSEHRQNRGLMQWKVSLNLDF
jgi:hypothetical protein